MASGLKLNQQPVMLECRRADLKAILAALRDLGQAWQVICLKPGRLIGIAALPSQLSKDEAMAWFGCH